MSLVALLALAHAQDYGFPTSIDHRQHFYPTAYKDHAGTDWDCGTITYGGHRGSDFGAGSFTGMDAGRDVTAAALGTVVTVHDGEFDRCTTGDCAGGSGFGNYVHIEHANGRSTWYAHLKQFSILVSPGDTVVCGQKLGEMGSSGYSTGPHLHFEVRNTSNVAEDPFDGPCSAPPTYWLDQGVYGDIPGACEAIPCVPEAELSCGDVVVGRNDDPGSTAVTYEYGCDDFIYSGPERSFTVLTDLDEPVNISLTGLSQDLDLVALDRVDCDGSGCLISSSNPNGSDESLVVDAQAGVPVTVVVDGWEGAVSDFVLEVSCNGSWGNTTPVDTVDTALPPTTTGPDTGTTGSTGSTGSTDTPVGDDDDDDGLDEVGTLVGPAAVAPRTTGCACQSATGPGAGGLLLLVGALVLRRRG